MKIEHHDRQFTFPDDWWVEAGMADFVPSSKVPIAPYKVPLKFFY